MKEPITKRILKNQAPSLKLFEQPFLNKSQNKTKTWRITRDRLILYTEEIPRHARFSSAGQST